MRPWSLLGAAALALHGHPALPTEPPRPETRDLPVMLGPIAQTAQSYAFNAAAHTRVPQDLASQGYIEEEYVLRGHGNIYEFPQVGALRTIGAGPYTTRILVRRPADPARFSGAVVVNR